MKSIFNLYDDDCEGKIDALYIGHVARACGLKPTNEQVGKAAGQVYKKLGKPSGRCACVRRACAGEKKLTYEEWLPIYEKLKKEKDSGTFADYLEGLKVFDKEETGKILAAEVKHVLMALGERLTAAEIEEVMDGVADAEGMIDYAGETDYTLLDDTCRAHMPGKCHSKVQCCVRGPLSGVYWPPPTTWFEPMSTSDSTKSQKSPCFL